MIQTNAEEHDKTHPTDSTDSTESTTSRYTRRQRKCLFRLALDALLMLLNALLAGAYTSKKKYDLATLWSLSFLISTGLLGLDLREYHNDYLIASAAPGEEE